MRDMAHSICLIKLYQITMRKNFDFLFLTTLSVRSFLLQIGSAASLCSYPFWQSQASIILKISHFVCNKVPLF